MGIVSISVHIEWVGDWVGDWVGNWVGFEMAPVESFPFGKRHPDVNWLAV